jgi:hypothetical protein
VGVRRALVESMLRLCCRDSVLANLSTALGPVPEDQADAYSFTTELYGSTRMLLACLTKADLAKVCCPAVHIPPGCHEHACTDSCVVPCHVWCHAMCGAMP